MWWVGHACRGQGSKIGHMPRNTDDALEFGSFLLLRAERQLLDNGEPVRLGGRVFDLLVALVERAGEVVSHETLTRQVWPSVLVEASSLRVHIAALRRALGDAPAGLHFIANLPGRGYSFVAPVRVHVAGGCREALLAMTRHNLPANLETLTGRDELLGTLRAQLTSPAPLRRQRLLSLCGPAGIGKSRVALALAGLAVKTRHFAHMAWVDLSVLDDAAGVPSAVARAMGQVAGTSGLDLQEQCMAGVGERWLLVFDHVDHVGHAVQQVVHTVLQRMPGARVLVAGREPMLTPGGHVHCLAPLGVPPARLLPADLSPTGPLSRAADAMAYPAVSALVEHLGVAAPGFELQDDQAETAAVICRRLAGVPLALALAAGTLVCDGDAPAKDLTTITACLDTVSGPSSPDPGTVHAPLPAPVVTALPGLLTGLVIACVRRLDGPAQVAWRRLSVFAGGFSLEDAAAVVADPGDDPLDWQHAIAGLARRALLQAMPDLQGRLRYRLLDLPRRLASQALRDHGESNAVARRHLLRVLEGLIEARRVWHAREDAADRQTRAVDAAAWMPELGAALGWAVATGADLVLGARLAEQALHWAQQGRQLDDYRQMLEGALARLGERALQDDALGERLREVRDGLSHLVGGVGHDAGAGLHDRGRGDDHDLAGAAEGLADGSTRPELPQAATAPRMPPEMLLAQWAGHFGKGDHGPALDWARQLDAAAQHGGDAFTALVAARALAQTQHALGRHELAWQHAQGLLESPLPLSRLGAHPILEMDARVSMGIVLARIAWLRDRPHEAQERLHELLRLASGSLAHGVAQVLTSAACPIALWSGDVEQASLWVTRLEEEATGLGLPHWQGWARRYRALLMGAMPDAITPRDGQQLDMFGTLGVRHALPAALKRVAAGMVAWSAPAVYRAEGERVLAEHADRAAAGAWFERALDAARRQGALAWERQALRSLAGVRRGEAVMADAFDDDGGLPVLRSQRRRPAA